MDSALLIQELSGEVFYSMYYIKKGILQQKSNDFNHTTEKV
jgi:hypothetical protein